MGYKYIVVLLTAGLLLFAAVFLLTFEGEAKKYRREISTAIKIEQTWELPGKLKEISGIAFLPPNKMACVQDEKGKIFIYNLSTSRIEREIEFAGKGDYEGIAIDGNVAYVLESNGTVYRVSDFYGAAKTSRFETFFTSKNDVEGLFFDKKNNRLLLAVKEKDPNSKDQKGIYEVNLPSMELNKKPVFKISLDGTFSSKKGKKEKPGSFYPSEVAVDPSSAEILVLEARRPQLLVLDSMGVTKALHKFDPKLFPQPEGVTFDASGNLYISNEGNPATIHRISITEK